MRSCFLIFVHLMSLRCAAYLFTQDELRLSSSSSFYNLQLRSIARKASTLLTYLPIYLSLVLHTYCWLGSFSAETNTIYPGLFKSYYLLFLPTYINVILSILLVITNQSTKSVQVKSVYLEVNKVMSRRQVRKELLLRSCAQVHTY